MSIDSPYQAIGAEVGADGVGLVTLRRGAQLNAISVRMRQEISHCLGAWRSRPDVRAVLLTGEGRAFSAGFDLAEFRDPALREELLASSTAYHRDVWSFPKPTLAAVNGLAAGGGLDLATLCDLRICAEGAWFSHPELKHGAPPLFTPLRWIVGDAVARDLCLTRRRVAAGEALRVGLVSQVAPADGLLPAARALLAGILEAPDDAIRFTKARMLAAGEVDFDRCLAEEHDRAFRELILRPGRWA